MKGPYALQAIPPALWHLVAGAFAPQVIVALSSVSYQATHRKQSPRKPQEAEGPGFVAFS